MEAGSREKNIQSFLIKTNTNFFTKFLFQYTEGKISTSFFNQFDKALSI